METFDRIVSLRLKLASRVIITVLSLISLRLFQLQIHSFQRFFSLGERNFLRTEKISSPRGNILDCHGRPLATNRPVTTLYWQGTGKKFFDPEQQTLLDLLCLLLSKESDFVSEVATAERFGKKIVITDDLSFDHLSRLIEQYPCHKNIHFATYYKRDYPHKEIGCHILGYLGTITNELAGKMGLEKIYEGELKGTPGQMRRQVNSKGRQLAEEEILKARKGDDLKTTINLDLQLLAEELFPSDKAGVLVAMNPQNGALKAIVSRPAFDPNIFIDQLGEQKWQQLKDSKQPFINRAFSALYPPASLFKLVTISAALETGLVEQESSWNCRGHVFFAGRPYHCAKKEGHGHLATMEAVAKSCNIPFFDIGKRIKIDTLADYAYRFGLGTKTNSTFPEKSGLVPSSSWKKMVKGEPWWPGETLSAAIGQSFLLATPIQMTCMVSAICEGFLVRPCILMKEAMEQEQSEKRMLEISSKTREFLKQSMVKAVRGGGTARGLNRFSNLEIYAKTGTAQTSSLAKSEEGGIYKEHSWFICYLKYRNFEPLTLLVLLENAGSSSFAAAVAKAFLYKYCKIADQNPSGY
jgi:penicillin-binding protein 2